MTRDEALDALALACFARAVDDPSSGGTFGEELAAQDVSLKDTTEVVARMVRLGAKVTPANYDQAVRVLAGRAR